MRRSSRVRKKPSWFDDDNFTDLGDNTTSDGNRYYQVKRILAQRMVNGTKLYLANFAGEPSQNSSWVKESQLGKKTRKSANYLMIYLTMYVCTICEIFLMIDFQRSTVEIIEYLVSVRFISWRTHVQPMDEKCCLRMFCFHLRICVHVSVRFISWYLRVSFYWKCFQFHFTFIICNIFLTKSLLLSFSFRTIMQYKAYIILSILIVYV